jgi:four helix bundle protein
VEQWSGGVLELWSNGAMERKNKNRGYQRLRVWQDAVTLYLETCRSFKSLPIEMKRVAGRAIASADPVHRNNAEGYCRRSIREYIYHLYIALASLGESVSGYNAYLKAGQVSEDNFENLDSQSFKLENGLLRLIDPWNAKGTPAPGPRPSSSTNLTAFTPATTSITPRPTTPLLHHSTSSLP